MRKMVSILMTILSIMLLSGLIQSVQAAELFWRLPGSMINLQHTFVADVMLDTDGQSINALEGTVHLTGTALKLERVINANSIVALWITPPVVPSQGQDIPFAGMIPSGYSGRQAILFSLVLTGVSGGSEILSADAIKAYANDGQGTAVAIAVREASVAVNPSVTESPSSILNFNDDTDQPENFTPIISRDTAIFNNKHFVAFSTQDKQSGVSRFEIQELRGTMTEPRADAWIPAISPYQLQDQNLRSTIFIRAFDNAGNTRVISLPPTSGQLYSWTTIYSILIGILVLLMVMLWYIKRKR